MVNSQTKSRSCKIAQKMVGDGDQGQLCRGVGMGEPFWNRYSKPLCKKKEAAIPMRWGCLVFRAGIPESFVLLGHHCLYYLLLSHGPGLGRANPRAQGPLCLSQGPVE